MLYYWHQLFLFFFHLFDLVLQIAPVENDNSYDELKRDAKMCLSLMSQGLLYPQQVPLVLQVLKQVSLVKTAQSFRLSDALCSSFILFVWSNHYYYKWMIKLKMYDLEIWKRVYETKNIWKRKVTLIATPPKAFFKNIISFTSPPWSSTHSCFF